MGSQWVGGAGHESATWLQQVQGSGVVMAHGYGPCEWNATKQGPGCALREHAKAWRACVLPWVTVHGAARTMAGATHADTITRTVLQELICLLQLSLPWSTAVPAVKGTTLTALAYPPSFHGLTIA